jgi:hypothetical protein
MNQFGYSGQAAVTAIAVQFPYAISYGEFYDEQICPCNGETFSLTKSQIKLTARLPKPRATTKLGSKKQKVTQTTGTTKAGFSKHGLKAIQITGASIANQIRPGGNRPLKKNCTNCAATRQDGRVGFAQKHPRWHLPNQASLYREQPGRWRQLGRRNHPCVRLLPLSRRRLSRQDVMAIWQHQR